jgi:two-component system KDP operon response regulator KdpE
MNGVRPTILLVEDEPEIRRFVRTALGAEGYRVVEAGTAHRGIVDAGSHRPDVAIVDLGLPDGDGLDIVRRVRQWSTMPIVVLSARGQESTKVMALDAGADDYVTKPFAVGELLARVRVALRHAARPNREGMVLRFERATVDLAARTATRDGQPLRLSTLEFRLLSVLAKQTGFIVTHRQLLSEVWGPSHVTDTHYLRVYMRQLREKLEADPARPRHLVTETGVGYRLVVD